MSQAAAFTPFSKPYFDLSAEQNVISLNTKFKKAEKIAFCLGTLTVAPTAAYVFKATTLAAAGSLPLVALALGSVMLVAGLYLHLISPNRMLEKQLNKQENIQNLIDGLESAEDENSINNFDFEILDLTNILSYLNNNREKFGNLLNNQKLPATFKNRVYIEYTKIRLPKLHEELASIVEEMKKLNLEIKNSDATIRSELENTLLAKDKERRKLIDEEYHFAERLALLGTKTLGEITPDKNTTNEALAKEILKNLKDNHELYLSNIKIPALLTLKPRDGYNVPTGLEATDNLLNNFRRFECAGFFGTLYGPLTDEHFTSAIEKNK